MKRMLLSIAATAMFTSAFAAVGDETVILNQTFEEGTVLSNTSEYIWGDDIQGMITANGLYVTNSSNAENNYTNREFVKFKSALGNATNALKISYELYNPKDKGQANTEYEINYFNAQNKFVFGIQETSGGWAYGANIITANEDGTTTMSALPAGHMSKGGGSVVDITVKYSGNTAIIEIDGGSYSAYTKSDGIKAVKLSVGGGNGYDRDMYIKYYEVMTQEVEAVQTANYTLKYVVGDEVIKETVKVGTVGDAIAINPDETKDFFNEENTIKYIYVGNDAEGKTIDAEGTTVVTLTYRIAGDFKYAVKNNVNDGVIASGQCIEGEPVTVAFSRYILANDGIVWVKEPIDKQYNYTFTPDADNYETTLEYAATEEVGVYFIEAEHIEGMTETTGNNANIRCSNSAGGYAEETVTAYTLKPGTYKVETAVWGSAGSTLVVKAGEEQVLAVDTNGSWTKGVSEEFTVTAETAITLEGSSSARPFDYLLITDAATTAVEAIEAVVAGDNNWYSIDGVRVAEPTRPGLYIHNGKKIIVK